MVEITTTTITITKEPEAQALKQKISPGTDPAVLRSYEAVLERSTDGVRVVLFLALYMPGKMVAAHGGAVALMPGVRGGDVLGPHGMRFSLSRLDLDEGVLVDGSEGPEELSVTEVAVIRSALEELLRGEIEDGLFLQ